MDRTLKDLRKAAKLTLREAVRRIREIDPNAPTTEVGLKHIENRGTQRLSLLRAMAAVYGVSLEDVETAANACSKNVKEYAVSA